MRHSPFVPLVIVLLCLAAPVSAQDRPAGEIAGGYSYLRDVTDDLNIPGGWFLAGGLNVTDIVAVVGEVSGAHKTEQEFGLEVNADLYTFMGGVRYYRRLAQVTPLPSF